MLEQAIRQHYQRYFVDPLALRIQHYISASHVTLLAAILGLCVIPALYLQHHYLAITCIITSGYLDTLDGTIARATNTSSALGTVYDILADRIVESSIIIGLWLVDPPTRALLCLLMFSSILLCITSFLIVGVFTPNNSDKSFHYSPGLIERAEALIFFSLMIILPHNFSILALTFILLVTLTTLVRLFEFRRVSDVDLF